MCIGIESGRERLEKATACDARERENCRTSAKRSGETRRRPHGSLKRQSARSCRPDRPSCCWRSPTRPASALSARRRGGGSDRTASARCYATPSPSCPPMHGSTHPVSRRRRARGLRALPAKGARHRMLTRGLFGRDYVARELCCPVSQSRARKSERRARGRRGDVLVRSSARRGLPLEPLKPPSTPAVSLSSHPPAQRHTEKAIPHIAHLDQPETLTPSAPACRARARPARPTRPW